MWSVVSQEEIEGEREGVKRCLRVDGKALHPRSMNVGFSFIRGNVL